MEVDPEDLEDGAGDDERVEAVEGRPEEVGHAQRVHPDPHLEDEGRQEQELGVVCNKNKRQSEKKMAGLFFWAETSPDRNAEVSSSEGSQLFLRHISPSCSSKTPL